MGWIDDLSLGYVHSSVFVHYSVGPLLDPTPVLDPLQFGCPQLLSLRYHSKTIWIQDTWTHIKLIHEPGSLL